MSKNLKRDTTNYSWRVTFLDSDGALVTGKTHSDITSMGWRRYNGGQEVTEITSRTPVSIASKATAHTDDGFLEDADDIGTYRYDVADAALETGSDSADSVEPILACSGVSSIVFDRIQLVDFDPTEDAERKANLVKADGQTVTATAEVDLDDLTLILLDTIELVGDLEDGGRLDLLIDAINSKTANLPASPAAVGSEMTLADGAIAAAKIAANALTAAKIASDAITAIQSGLATAASVTTTETNVLNAINNLNQGTTRHITINTAPTYKIPESGTEDYEITILTHDVDGELADIDASANPTLTMVGSVTGDLTGNLSAWSHPSTGKYIRTYTATNGDDDETVKLEASGAINGQSREVAYYLNINQLVNEEFNATHAGWLQAIHNMLPSKSKLMGSDDADGGFDSEAKEDINAEADAALADHDPPTKAELEAAVSAIRGADSDTLKSLSDQLDGVGGTATIEKQNEIIADIENISLGSGTATIEKQNEIIAAINALVQAGIIRPFSTSGIHQQGGVIYAKKDRGITRDLRALNAVGADLPISGDDLLRVYIGRHGALGTNLADAEFSIVSGTDTANGSSLTIDGGGAGRHRLRLDASDLTFAAGTYTLFFDVFDDNDGEEWKELDQFVFNLRDL